MGHITLDELSNNLKDYLEALGEKQGDVTSETIGSLNDLNTQSKTNIVAAINELNTNLNELRTELEGQIEAAANTLNDIIDLL